MDEPFLPALNAFAGSDEEVDQDVGAADQHGGDKRHQHTGFPRPARCGLELCEPMAQTMAVEHESGQAGDDPTVNSAPTMLDRVPIPGRPVDSGTHRRQR